MKRTKTGLFGRLSGGGCGCGSSGWLEEEQDESAVSNDGQGGSQEPEDRNTGQNPEENKSGDGCC